VWVHATTNSLSIYDISYILWHSSDYAEKGGPPKKATIVVYPIFLENTIFFNQLNLLYKLISPQFESVESVSPDLFLDCSRSYIVNLGLASLFP
jgi:hypothetical protein